MNDIQFTLNGKTVSYAGSAADRLLDVLRDTFRCTSVKCGCKEGECGACSVLLDGKLINSCCVAMGAVDGSTIVTLEGYGDLLRSKPLRRLYPCLMFHKAAPFFFLFSNSTSGANSFLQDHACRALRSDSRRFSLRLWTNLSHRIQLLCDLLRDVLPIFLTLCLRVTLQRGIPQVCCLP